MSLLNETYYFKSDGADGFLETSQQQSDPLYEYPTQSIQGGRDWLGYPQYAYFDFYWGYGTNDTDFAAFASYSLSLSATVMGDSYYQRPYGGGIPEIWFNGKKKLCLKVGARCYDHLGNPVHTPWPEAYYHWSEYLSGSSKFLSNSFSCYPWIHEYTNGSWASSFSLLTNYNAHPSRIVGIKRVQYQDIGLRIKKPGGIVSIGATSYLQESGLRIAKNGVVYALGKTYIGSGNEWDSGWHIRGTSGSFAAAKLSL